MFFTGGIWCVKVKIKKGADAGQTITVGCIMIESDGRGMNRLGTFDEMLGCVKCNAIQHKNTRIGLRVLSPDKSIRRPTEIKGATRASQSTCKRYRVAANRRNGRRISFESGPLTDNIFPEVDTKTVIWPL